jgi:hypothetical protein
MPKMFYSYVDSLCISCASLTNDCAKNVYNNRFIHHVKKSIFGYTQNLHNQFTILINSFLVALTTIKLSYTHYPHSLLKLYIYIKENE